MAHGAIFDMASRLHDFEPFHLADGLCGAGQGILDRVLDAFLGRAHEFQNLVNVILHSSDGWHG
jgi:hypothetical protein